ncbi:MAG: UDP-glucose/GDP-mannose dehydrogenase family protein [Acidimicrobiales bacterium]|nr:UDP-glucose/GDP-mannose dehydrogenase family protein [Acidimicrobiales bacterium]
MKLSVIGTGYVGLVSGVCLAHVGHEVQCVDIDADKVDRINLGNCPIHEDGLPKLLTGVLDLRFNATTDLTAAVHSTDLTLIAVGTPFGEERIDLAQIESAARAVGEALATKDGYHVVAVKSTVVPGTTETVVLPILEEASGKKAGADFGVGMNPEFLREGVAVPDFLNPDRIVVGGIDERTRDVMAELYKPFPQTDLIRTTPSTAEMIKYTANSLLATLISFSNEIGNMSAAVGVDVTDVLAGVHLDHRFAPILEHRAEKGERIRPAMLTYLGAGCGFGGSCFPKDVKALAAHAKAHGVDVPVLRGALEVNEHQPEELVKLVADRVDAPARITVLGVAFKPGTDDVRESPTLRIVPRLVELGYDVTVHDPIALDEAEEQFGDTVTYVEEFVDAIKGADAIVLVTSWPEYRLLAEELDDATPLVADGRRFLDPDDYANYVGIGYPADPA